MSYIGPNKIDLIVAKVYFILSFKAPFKNRFIMCCAKHMVPGRSAIRFYFILLYFCVATAPFLGGSN